MIHKKDFSFVSSENIEAMLSRQLEYIRLSRNLTQAQLARQAGVSRSTIARMAQDGKGISLDSFIRIMQALQLQSHLEALLPEPGISPLERLELDGKDRQRARSKSKDTEKWTWTDEEGNDADTKE